MKTSEPDKQFLTSLKNGKVGPFRVQTTRAHMATLLNGKVEFEETDHGSLYIGCLEIIFHKDTDLLTRVRIDFSTWEGIQPWQKWFSISWIDWVAQTPCDAMVSLLDAQEFPFRSILYTDNSSSLLVMRSPATIQFGFGASGEPLALVLDFESRSQALADIKALQGYHL
ncbi:hypothetical protein [Deinococcus sp. UYEF24]